MLGLLAGSAIAIVGTSLFGYLVHRALHKPWMGVFHTKHMTHHETLYPAEDFYSEGTYRSAGKDSTTWTFLLLGLPLVAAPFLAAHVGAVSLTTGFVLLAEVLLMGWLHDFIHDRLHIKDHVLQMVPLFSRWAELHRSHHVDMSKNFGIFSFVWDRVFGTFRQ